MTNVMDGKSWNITQITIELNLAQLSRDVNPRRAVPTTINQKKQQSVQEIITAICSISEIVLLFLVSLRIQKETVLLRKKY